MKEMTLAELSGERGPASVAAALGCTPGAICNAITDGRDIRVRVYRNRLEAIEVRPFPSQRRNKAAEEQQDAAGDTPCT